MLIGEQWDEWDGGLVFLAEGGWFVFVVSRIIYPLSRSVNVAFFFIGILLSKMEN